LCAIYFIAFGVKGDENNLFVSLSINVLVQGSAEKIDKIGPAE